MYTFSPGIVTGMIPAPQLLIGPVEALVVIVSLLVVCCGVLWLLTGATGGAASAQALSARSRVGSRTTAAQGLRSRVGISARAFDTPRVKSRTVNLAKAR